MLTLALLAQDQPAETGQVGWIVGAGAAGSAMVVLLGLLEIARRIRRWVRDQAAQVHQAVDTTNGRTLGQTAKDTADAVDELAGLARDNRTLITDVQRRLDEHIVRGHGGGSS